MEFDYKMVIVARKNLELSPGKLAVQVAHAAVACSLDTKKENSKWLSDINILSILLDFDIIIFLIFS